MYSDWYFEGIRAFLTGVDICPYDELSEPYINWWMGWNKARADSEENISILSE